MQSCIVRQQAMTSTISIFHPLQGIEPLLDNMFSFLRRKTDFFAGASPAKVEELVLSVLKKHSTLSEKTEAEKRREKEKEEKKRKDRIAMQKKVFKMECVVPFLI